MATKKKKEDSNLEVNLNQEEPEVKQASQEETFEQLFDQLLTDNKITKDVKVKNVTLTLQPLSTSEYLEAETIHISNISTVPADVIHRFRMVSTLAYSVVAINGIEIEEENKRDIRLKIHKMLLKVPPSVIDYMYGKYTELVNEQSKMYVDLEENIENF